MISLEQFLRAFNLVSYQDSFHLYKHLKSHQNEVESFSRGKYQWDHKFLTLWSKWSFTVLTYLVCKSIIITILIIYVDYFHKETSFLGQVRAFVPDPFNEVRIFMAMITLGVPLTLYVALFFWLKSIQTYPMFMQTIRFILEPELEIKRLDGMTIDFVEKQIGSVERARWNLIQELCCSYCGASTGQGRKTMEGNNSGWFSLTFSLKQFAKFRRLEHYSKLRPYIYTPDWLKMCHKRVKKFLILLIAYAYNNLLVFLVSVLYKATIERCKRSSATRCNLMIAYNASELIYLVEILLLCFKHATVFIYLTMQLYLGMVNLHTLVDGLRGELTKCLDKLRYFNSRLYATKGEMVHQLLEEMSIKLSLFDEDVRSVVESLSSLLSLSLMIVAILVGTFLLGYKVDHKITLANSLNLDLPVTLIYLCAWLTCNITAIITAYTNRRTTKTLALYWSIDAELMHFESRKQMRRVKVGYLANRWHKLGLYLNDQEANQYAMRPFGLDLTYGDIVEYNFYIISALTFVYQ